MGVPILRIPVVALRVLFKHFDNVELVKISSLSERADWFLKICGKKNVSFFNLDEYEISGLRKIEKLELLLLESRRRGELPEWNFQLRCSVVSKQYISISCIHFEVLVFFKNLKDNEKAVGVRKNLKVGDCLVPVVIDGSGRAERISTFWSSKTDGMIAFMDYFRNKFNLSIEELKLTGKNTKAIRAVVNHINSTQTVVREVVLNEYPPVSEDDFKFILKNVSPTERFSSQFKFGRSFKFKGTICAKSIDIENGHWVTIQNLLASENEVINVRRSNYTKEELRTFLNEWKAGNIPKLKEVELATKVSTKDVIEGYERWEGECGKCECRDCYVIKIRGHGDCHGGMHSCGGGGFRMSIHEN